MRLSDKGQELLQKYNDIYNGKEYYQENNLVTDEKKTIFDGFSMYKHLWPKLNAAIEPLQSFTLLDYGCGRARHVFNPVLPNKLTFHEYFNGKCQCYYCFDPANPLYMRKPPVMMKFDIIVCADVMEHIAEEDVPTVIRDIASYMHEDTKVLFSICGLPAMKSFADNGENLHITVKDRNWWKQQIAQQMDIKKVTLAWHG